MQVGVPKTESLQSTCAALNSQVRIVQHKERMNPDNAVTLCAAYDVVADCSDNPTARYLVNDACVATGVPLVSGAAVGTDGQLSVYGYKGGPCYRYACMYSALSTVIGPSLSSNRKDSKHDSIERKREHCVGQAFALPPTRLAAGLVQV